MTEILYESDRYFQIWQYSVSKCRLLLRSTRDNPPATRVDIHFGGVGIMLLRPAYDGISIRYASVAERKQVDERYGAAGIPGELYIISAPSEIKAEFDQRLQSFVTAGPLQWHEDDGYYDAPSWFGHMPGTS